MRLPTLLLVLSLAACGGSTDPAPALDAAPIPVDAPVDAPGKEAACASTFGNTLTNAFGRVDGTVLAVVPPGDPRCALPNGDHLVVQVLFGGAAYRMVINVESNGADPAIRVHQTTAPLPAPAFADGWHPGLRLDYPTDLAVHSDAAWDALPLAAASQRIYDAIEVGAPIAVYASSSGGTRAESAHLVHRNGNGKDGALVIDPTSANPRWLLFRFADQTF